MRIIFSIVFCVYLFSFFNDKCYAIQTNNDPNKYKEELKEQWADVLQEATRWTNPEYNRDFQNYSISPCSDYGIFDFIIVGAGSAGAVIANRLSENRKNKVLLIEAGGEETKFSLVPLNSPYLLKTKMNWGYKTTTQNNICLLYPEGKCPYNRGKSLGGSSAINYMVMSRGNKYDFRKWVNIGNTDWSYKKILKYYKRSETVSGYGSRHFRGKNGPTYVSRASPGVNLYDTLKKAYEDVFLLENRDYNGLSQIGLSLAQNNIKSGIRQSSNQAYLEPIKNSRKNLHILTHAFATKIEFDNNRATQIRFLHEGTCKIAKVSKEIIVSGGVINSPHLLQLSGIGPKNLLQKYNIEVVQDLPVGENFQDHPGVANGLEILTNYSLTQKSFDEELDEYVHESGRFNNLFTSEISYHNIYNKSSSNPQIEYIYRLNYNTMAPTTTEVSYQAKFVMSIILQHSTSRGTIRIKSADPLDYPVLDPHYLDNPKEMDTLVDALEFLNNIVDTPSFQKYGAKINEEPLKIDECQKLKNRSRREFWACIVRYNGIGCNHGSSTCSMGPDPKSAVVNQDLKVHGIENLRVADASIFPLSLSGHVHSSALMVGEKAADLIINDPRWSKK